MPFEIFTLTADSDLAWPFEGEPCYRVLEGSYGRHVKVDPFPAYAHSKELIVAEMEKVGAAFPIAEKVHVFILDREPIERTNAWCSIGCDYDAPEVDGRKPWSATIVMAGKRIPIHPAMTRYLVSHEYGHVVAEAMRRRRKEKDGERALYKEYADLRGFETAKNYGGGTWHRSVEELFANDFRILVCEAEKEFWPHPGFRRPEEVPAIVEFWKSAVAEFRPVVLES